MPVHGRVGAKAFTFFPFLKSAARPRSGQKRAGKKEGVLGEGIFARPPKIPAEFLPRLRRGSRSISFKVGSDLVV